jgi:hypothetical protein
LSSSGLYCPAVPDDAGGLCCRMMSVMRVPLPAMTNVLWQCDKEFHPSNKLR